MKEMKRILEQIRDELHTTNKIAISVSIVNVITLIVVGSALF